MKKLLCGLLSLSALHGLQAGTAYEALRAVGKQKGDALLDKVVEVRAAKGAPEPATWKIAVQDGQATNGIREYDVKGVAVSGERTPAMPGTPSVLNINQLNLDSDGAHTVAEREAKKSGFAYDHVNYLLRGSGKGGAPVWELRLVDEQNGNIAVLTMAADTGKLLTAEGLDKGSAPVAKVKEKGSGNPDRPVDGPGVARGDEPPPPDREREREREREEEKVDKPGNKLTRFANRAGRHIGGAFQRFGEKIDRTFNSSPKPRQTAPPPRSTRSSRDSNGTEYYRPRD